MPLQDAILALGPWFYWPMGEGSGTSFGDATGHGVGGTLTGTADLSAAGPEVGTTAVRLYSDGIIVSPGLSLTAWNSISVMLFLTTPANGAPSNYVDLWGIGDPANRHDHGVWGQFRSNSNTDLRAGANGTAIGLNTGFQGVLPFWHVMTTEYNALNNTSYLYADQSQTTWGGQNYGKTFVATDRLWIQSSYPIVISHVAVFTRALSNTEVNNIAALINAWPYGVPINSPPAQVAPPVDLTPVTDDTQAILANQQASIPILQNIQSLAQQAANAWQQYTSVTLPSLNDLLNQIQNNVTSAIQGITSALPVPIGQILTQPESSIFSDHNLTGGVTCDRVDIDLGLTLYAGVVLYVRQYPDDWQWRTPDQNYSFNDLAVLTFWDGDRIRQRHGIHNRSHTVTPIPGALPFGAGQLLGYVVPAGTHVTVDWAAGVCGELIGMFPSAGSGPLE